MTTPEPEQKEVSAARALAAATEAIASKARREPGAVHELLDSLDQSVFEIAAEVRSPALPRSIADLLEELEEIGGGEGGVSTGIEALDDLLGGGWHPGAVTVVAGQPQATSTVGYRFALAAASTCSPEELISKGGQIFGRWDFAVGGVTWG
jgi:replicative DNA helicase